jgi:hypothetical protein
MVISNSKIIVGAFTRMDVWEPTSLLRYLKKPNTKILQQMWFNRTNGKKEWRDVATVEEDSLEAQA